MIAAAANTVTGGSGSVTVLATSGTNSFIAGTGTLDVTGGTGKDAYMFHVGSGLLKIDDFSTAKGDTLTVDAALKSSLVEASDGHGGVMLSFAAAGHGVDIAGMSTLPAAQIYFT
jgi:hypothetical protein